jgi:hypothetical protein
MGAKKQLKPFYVIHPRELAFLRGVRSLPPGALPDLIKAMRMTVDKRPPNKTRAAWLRFFEAAEFPQAEWRARTNQIMASGIAELVRNK